MLDDIAINAENLSKVYKLYSSPVDRLKEALHPLRQRYHQDFHALQDVSFQIKKGEAVGIIGKNGSGKSTLLKILSGVLTPSSGSVTVNGKLSALLELGAGFNPELSGYDNIFFNGMLMGYTREEVAERLDDILAFADIGSFVYQPVKTYSSGMFIRLAFALAVHVEPDILIVDEALSVGDLFFQQKCFAKIKSIVESNITVLFVSHDLPGIQKLCSRGILLKEGAITFDGNSVECVSAYTFREKKNTPAKENLETPNADAMETVAYAGVSNLITDQCVQQGDKALQIQAVRFKSSATCQVNYGERASIEVAVKANQFIANPIIGFALFDRLNNLIFSTNTSLLNRKLQHLGAFEEVVVSFSVTFTIQPGLYSLSVGCTEASSIDDSDVFIHHRCIGLGPITVSSANRPPFHGMAFLPCEVKLLEGSDD